MRRVGQIRKRDANEPAIVQALQKVGVLVQRISQKGFADLVCWHAHWGFRLIEVKSPKGRATEAQTHASLQGWPIWTVRNVDEALDLFRRP